MNTLLTNKIYITEPSKEIVDYAETLYVDNPNWAIAQRTGNPRARFIPKKLCMYERRGNTLVLPFGTLRHVWEYIKDTKYSLAFTPTMPLNMQGDMELYDYQREAVQALVRAKGGALEAPCGSGKTQMGLAVIKEIGFKALWLTHTHKLMEQSKERCERYFKGDFGAITEGKVNIGKDITFATVQTMAKLSPTAYENQFNVVVVDECFPGYMKVLTATNGYVPIEDINVGDMVASYNEGIGCVEYKKVLRKFVKKPSAIVKVNVGGKEIYCTPNHKFYTRNGWKEARELSGYSDTIGKYSDRSGWKFPLFTCKKRTGQEKRRFLKWVRVGSVAFQKQRSDGTFVGMHGKDIVYNIEVEDNHNYFVEGYLVHNCHHCAGTPTMVKQFYEVVGNCKARYKYGLSATLTRADGLIPTIYALLGDIAYRVPESVVGDKIIHAEHVREDINIKYDIRDYCDTDGMLDYTRLITMLSENRNRSRAIAVNIVRNVGRKQLVLCHRVQMCKDMVKILEAEGIKADLVVGSVKNRQYGGEVIVATYALAKEGLDIPELEVLHLATPQKNESTTKQAVGRIERNIKGKKTPICFDYVDTDIPYCVSAYKRRKNILKKRG